MKKFLLFFLLLSLIFPLSAATNPSSFSWMYGLMVRKVSSLKNVVSHLLFAQPVDPRKKVLQQEWCALFWGDSKPRTADEVKDLINLFLNEHQHLFGDRLVEDLINNQEDSFRLRRTLFHGLVAANTVKQDDELYNTLMALGARTNIADITGNTVMSMLFDKKDKNENFFIKQPTILENRQAQAAGPLVLLEEDFEEVATIKKTATIDERLFLNRYVSLSTGLYVVATTVALVYLYKFSPLKSNGREQAVVLP